MNTTALPIRPRESRASQRSATGDLPASRSVTLEFDDNQLLPILYGEHDRNLARIEMRLVARGDQEVRIPELGELRLADGESIITEFSYKYDEPIARDILRRSGLTMQHWLTDEAATFALALASR